MSFFQFKEKDILLIKETQPQLIYEHRNKILKGFLQFEAEYQNHKIKDKYKLEIDFKNQNPLPLVKEVNGRIEKIAKDKNLNLTDLHVNGGDMDKGLCLCSRFKAFEYINKLQKSLSASIDFIQELVIPFLYNISHFEKYNKFPFEEIEHGVSGLIEEATHNKQYFEYLPIYIKTFPEEAKKFICGYIQDSKLENVIYKNEKIGRNKPCPCNSGLKYKKCHLNIVDIISNCLYAKENKRD